MPVLIEASQGDDVARQIQEESAELIAKFIVTLCRWYRDIPGDSVSEFDVTVDGFIGGQASYFSCISQMIDAAAPGDYRISLSRSGTARLGANEAAFPPSLILARGAASNPTAVRDVSTEFTVTRVDLEPV
jgi:hypothetical protein